MNVPNLRFEGFSDEWILNKVGSICDFIVPGRNKPTEFRGDIPWITTPDIEQNGIVTASKKNLNITIEEAKIIGSKIVPKNSILISCVGDLGLIAISGIDLIINQQLHAFLPKENIYFKFLLYALTTQKPYMEKVATKTAVPYMNKDNCNSIPVIMPSLPEQTKIANFLTAIDEKITQLTQKNDLLAQYKKGVMQQIFSQNLRFKDEDGREFPEWEERLLCEISNITTGQSNRIDSTLTGEYTFFDRSQDIRTSDIYLFDCEAIIVAGEGQEFLPKYFIGKFDLHQRTYTIMNFKDESYGKYLFYYIHHYRSYFLSQAVGSTVKSLRLPMFQKMPIKLPCLVEQTRIANFLTAIDDKITHTKTQLDAVKLYKKGLLQQMFV
ncbi:restriction endonuclease subunit S [Nitrosomonas sp.]|uniref:restriction endonuclease subunit S n=1 Tax=Nitrosomonas sp. TaxID=42353 RepID=UPI00374D675A